MDLAFESACEKDVCALNGITEPQVWEREEEDTTEPNNHITTPDDGDIVESPLTVEGYATDFGGSGVVLLDYMLEWAGGSYDGEEYVVDPPSTYVEYELGPIDLEDFIEPGDWITITIYATDDAENTGTDSVTVTWGEGEDTTPPVTEKTIGGPNEEGGYIIWPHTPIWLNAEDPEPGSGVNYIYYEIAWDPEEDGVWDYVFEEIVYDTSVEIQLQYWEIYYGLVELRWYAVDNVEVYVESPYQPIEYLLLEDFNCGWC